MKSISVTSSELVQYRVMYISIIKFSSPYTIGHIEAILIQRCETPLWNCQFYYYYNMCVIKYTEICSLGTLVVIDSFSHKGQWLHSFLIWFYIFSNGSSVIFSIAWIMLAIFSVFQLIREKNYSYFYVDPMNI